MRVWNYVRVCSLGEGENVGVVGVVSGVLWWFGCVDVGGFVVLWWCGDLGVCGLCGFEGCEVRVGFGCRFVGMD